MGVLLQKHVVRDSRVESVNKIKTVMALSVKHRLGRNTLIDLLEVILSV